MPPVEGTITDEALEEILLAISNIGPALEGLRDYSRLNIKPETLEVVNSVILEHERRLLLLSNSRDALTALLADGYPLLPDHEVGQIVYLDLEDQLNTITAAFKHFTPNTANVLGLTAGPAEPKS